MGLVMGNNNTGLCFVIPPSWVVKALRLIVRGRERPVSGMSSLWSQPSSMHVRSDSSWWPLILQQECSGHWVERKSAPQDISPARPWNAAFATTDKKEEEREIRGVVSERERDRTETAFLGPFNVERDAHTQCGIRKSILPHPELWLQGYCLINHGTKGSILSHCSLTAPTAVFCSRALLLCCHTCARFWHFHMGIDLFCSAQECFVWGSCWLWYYRSPREMDVCVLDRWVSKSPIYSQPCLFSHSGFSYMMDFVVFLLYWLHKGNRDTYV